MHYDPCWNKEDVLQLKAQQLNLAESVIVHQFQRMIHTPEDLYYFHIERQQARLKANREFSKSRWLQLKAQRQR